VTTLMLEHLGVGAPGLEGRRHERLTPTGGALPPDGAGVATGCLWTPALHTRMTQRTRD
jgi:hypothetical protein